MSVYPSVLEAPLEPVTAGWGGQPAVTFAAAPITWVRGHVFADSRRLLQICLGLIWVLDGALQFQSFMYGQGFIAALKATGLGQPSWIAHSVTWAANTMQSQQGLFNTLFALLQIAIGLGLLHRRTVKTALAASFAWSLLLWWFGEGFGMMFMGTASPFSGAPGAAILYPIVGLIVWPSERAGGLLGVRGARLTWAALWLMMAWLWLGPAGSGPYAVSKTISGAPSGIASLTRVQTWLATATAGHGLAIGMACAGLSAVIGIAVAGNWHARAFLGLSVLMSLGFWSIGQGFGGIFAGGATDPNSGPMFILLACALYALVPYSSDCGLRTSPGASVQAMRT